MYTPMNRTQKLVVEDRCPVCAATRGKPHDLGCVFGNVIADSRYLESQLDELLKQGGPVESDV
jgi:hypothetical protein